MAEKSEDVGFKDADEEFSYHLISAESHIRSAIDQCGKPDGVSRSLLCKTLLQRAHGIILGLYIQEARNTRRPDE